MLSHLGETTLRTARMDDLPRLANLIHFEPQVHRHLDWRPPLDWLGQSPYLVLERFNRLEAALACPPDPPNVAWIRLLAVNSDFPAKDAWEALWENASQQLAESRAPTQVAAIPLQSWFQQLLEQSKFNCSHNVIVLAWRGSHISIPRPVDGAIIRAMSLDDIPAVGQVDAASFGPLWQNSLECIQIAFRQAAIATVYELEGEIVGYQISTLTPMGGHLARLAVKPAYQGRGIGQAAISDLISQFLRRGVTNVTVNTQNDNMVSLNLYRKIGFQSTGEEYPVYQRMI